MKYISLILCLIGPLYASMAQDEGAILQYGYELMAEQEYVLALQQFELAEDVTHGSPHARIGMGKAYYMMKQYNSAQNALQSVERYGDYPEAHYYLGLSLFAMKDYSSALNAFNRVYVTDTLHDDLDYYIGASEFETGQNKKAISRLRQYTQRETQSPYAYYYLSQALLVESKYDSSKIAIVSALSINPRIPRFHRAYGDIYFAQGDFSGALLSYSTALDLNPNFAEARFRRGVTYMSMSSWRLAISDFERAKERMPREAKILEFMAECQYEVEDYEGVELSVSNLLEIAPDRIDMLFKRGLARFLSEKYEGAIDDFSILADAYPKDSQVQLYLGNCYQGKKDYPSAAFHYTQAVELDFENLRAHHNRAVVLFEIGNKEQACKAWTWLSERTDEYFSNLGKEYVAKFCTEKE